MPRARNLPLLSRAALVSSLLSSAISLSACADQAPPVAPSPPPVLRPCELPFQDKAGELAPQTDLDKPLPGDDLSRLYGQDAAAYNALFPKFNANIAWAGARCVSKPSSAAAPSQ